MGELVTWQEIHPGDEVKFPGYNPAVYKVVDREPGVTWVTALFTLSPLVSGSAYRASMALHAEIIKVSGGTE